MIERNLSWLFQLLIGSAPELHPNSALYVVLRSECTLHRSGHVIITIFLASYREVEPFFRCLILSCMFASASFTKNRLPYCFHAHDEYPNANDVNKPNSFKQGIQLRLCSSVKQFICVCCNRIDNAGATVTLKYSTSIYIQEDLSQRDRFSLWLNDCRKQNLLRKEFLRQELLMAVENMRNCKKRNENIP